MRHTPHPPRVLGPRADLWPRRPELWSSNIGRQLGRRANVSGEALGRVRQRCHGPRSSPRRSTHGSSPAPGHPDVPLDSRRGSHDDVGARDDALPDDAVAFGALTNSYTYSGAAARMITWFGTLSDGRGLLLQTRTPREAPLAGSGEWDHKQALYPLPRPAHTQPKPLPNRPWSRRRGGCRGAQTVPHERHTGHHGPSGGPSAAPHPPDALGQPAPTLRGFTAASAPSAPPSPRATRAPGRTPERRPII